MPARGTGMCLHFFSLELTLEYFISSIGGCMAVRAAGIRKFHDQCFRFAIAEYHITLLEERFYLRDIDRFILLLSSCTRYDIFDLLHASLKALYLIYEIHRESSEENPQYDRESRCATFIMV
jgi:hypothetical protein